MSQQGPDVPHRLVESPRGSGPHGHLAPSGTLGKIGGHAIVYAPHSDGCSNSAGSRQRRGSLAILQSDLVIYKRLAAPSAKSGPQSTPDFLA